MFWLCYQLFSDKLVGKITNIFGGNADSDGDGIPDSEDDDDDNDGIPDSKGDHSFFLELQLAY